MRIITFGCSYTYGHGLSDCILEDKITQGPKSSELAWPSMLSQKFNCNYVNLGKSGNSNKEIWNDVLNFNFQKDDVAVILWTYLTRYCLIKSNGIKRINPWNNQDRFYFMNYSDRNDTLLDFYGRMNHLDFYLHNKGIQNFNFLIEDLDSKSPSWNKSKISGKFETVDQADDKCHPGNLSHRKFADEVFEILKQ